jgi:hypothetical protein
VKQAKVTHFERGLHLLLERPDIVAVRAGDDEVIDIDPDHQLHVAISPDIDGVFQWNPLKAE